MHFVIEKVSKTSGRLGCMVQRRSGDRFKTPLLVQTTKSGSIPYLSRDMFEYVSKDLQILQMSLSTMDTMAESLSRTKSDVSSYVGYEGYPAILLIRDPCVLSPSGHNDKDTIPLFTRRGKELVTADKFMNIIECFAPDIYQGLCDADTNADSGNKRVQKSVDRTEKFMDRCYERQRDSKILVNSSLFAPIVGGYNKFARSQSIKHAKDNSNLCKGYILEGFHNYGLSATEVEFDKLLPITMHCIQELEQDKAKMMPGAYTPIMILELISAGVDIFDTSYAYCAAVNFKALSFNFDVKAEKLSTLITPFLDLTDDIYKEDFSPFIQKCSCLACQKHTRAYVHHLCKTKELLGPILLMIHNLHHFMTFFKTIRSHMEKNNLIELKSLIANQHSDSLIDYRIYENAKVISKATLDREFTAADASSIEA